MPRGTYLTRLNDVWAVGIILLNICAGRNPWHSAHLSDQNYIEYLDNPSRMLSTYFPISKALVELLKMLLAPEADRTSLGNIRSIVMNMDTFFLTNNPPKGVSSDATKSHKESDFRMNALEGATVKRRPVLKFLMPSSLGLTRCKPLCSKLKSLIALRWRRGLLIEKGHAKHPRPSMQDEECGPSSSPEQFSMTESVSAPAPNPPTTPAILAFETRPNNRSWIFHPLPLCNITAPIDDDYPSTEEMFDAIAAVHVQSNFSIAGSEE